MKKSARQTAFEILFRVEKNSAYSNLLLDELLSSSGLDTRDKAFVSNLVYGVIERKITLDYQLSAHLSQPLKKLKPQVLVILRMGVYQILFMDKVPKSAAVNESVKLVKANKCAFAAGVVNAVLRKCGELILPDKNSEDYLSVKYSCPKWLIHKWCDEYGKENAERLIESCIGKPDTVIRVNTLKTTADELIIELENEGVKAEKGMIENSLVISLSGNEISLLTAYKNGLFHVQDTASQYCAKAVGAKDGETVFDLCSAPGGKAFTVSQHMNNKGKLFAFDIYDHRTKLISDSAVRLGIDIIEAKAADAKKFNDTLGKADRVLCDVPCSGLGIIRRKPEIKYKNKESLDGLPAIQLKILENGARYVADGGRLIYSTCTLSKAENENVCEKFLSEHKDFRAVAPLGEISDKCFVTLMPHKNGCDGFFIATFEKK